MNTNTSSCVCNRYPQCCEESWSQQCVDAIEELECNEQCEDISVSESSALIPDYYDDEENPFMGSQATQLFFKKPQNCCTALPTPGCNSVEVSRCNDRLRLSLSVISILIVALQIPTGTCRHISNELCCRSHWSAECIHAAEELGCLSC